MTALTKPTVILAWAFILQSASADSLDSSTGGGSVWSGTIGEGFRSGTIEAGFSLGAGPGMRIFGSDDAHDLALGELHLGWMFTDVVGGDSWYRGNWELIAEGYGGWQFSPETDYLAGFMPLLRYNFATRTRFIPFAEGGVGAALTEIDAPDLSGDWQFSLGGGAGVHWFFRDNTALTFHYRFLHLSNGGREDPNKGLNTSLFHLGVTWFF